MNSVLVEEQQVPAVIIEALDAVMDRLPRAQANALEQRVLDAYVVLSRTGERAALLLAAKPHRALAGAVIGYLQVLDARPALSLPRVALLSA